MSRAGIAEVLRGTAQNDRLRGTNGADRIYALGGADDIAKFGGADRLLGRPGRDSITSGNVDYIYCGGAALGPRSGS